MIKVGDKVNKAVMVLEFILEDQKYYDNWHTREGTRLGDTAKALVQGCLDKLKGINMFKVGDRVICIGSYREDNRSNLPKEGNIYTISGYNDTFPILKEFGEHPDNYWDDDNFELHTSEEIKPPSSDLINAPDHYRVGGVDTLDFIEAKELNFRLANAVKYLVRCEHKGSKIADLKKAIFYIQREIDKSESQSNV